MKQFTSYGPPHPDSEYMVQRPKLVQDIAQRLIGRPDTGGHYFTVFAPRQVGKTTTLRQVQAHIRQHHGDAFHVCMSILHLVTDLRAELHRLLGYALGMTLSPFESWGDVYSFFHRNGPLKKPLILILDEFDALPKEALNEAVAFFRACYHNRDETFLHGVALIGVHAVLGDIQGTTSPFNIQRSVHIPNLTHDEVLELFHQYQHETLQPIEPEAVERIWDLMRGQPGLTCWFGELLTEKYNPVQPPPCQRKDGPPDAGYPPLTLADVHRVTSAAQFEELNNNVRNLMSKARQHLALVTTLFTRHDVKFDLNVPEVQWLHINGVIVGVLDEAGTGKICAFASPFVQRCLFSAFGSELGEEYRRLEPTLDSEGPLVWKGVRELDVPVLLALYRNFLDRQARKGLAPWLEQPGRADARPYEAVGHFNLYAWLYATAKGGFTIVPEFPTGNGTADLWLSNRKRGLQEVIEIKSFSSSSDLQEALEQTARYARSLKLTRAWLVMMADASATEYLRQRPSRALVDGIDLSLEVIPWGWVQGLPDEGRQRSPEKGTSALPSGEAALGLPPAPPVSPARAPYTLDLEDRLALEDRVVPLLTLRVLQRLWLQLTLPPELLVGEDLPLLWDQLVTRSLLAGQFPLLMRLLPRHLPELTGEPLLERLKEVRAG